MTCNQMWQQQQHERRQRQLFIINILENYSPPCSPRSPTRSNLVSFAQHDVTSGERRRCNCSTEQSAETDHILMMSMMMMQLFLGRHRQPAVIGSWMVTFVDKSHRNLTGTTAIPETVYRTGDACFNEINKKLYKTRTCGKQVQLLSKP